MLVQHAKVVEGKKVAVIRHILGSYSSCHTNKKTEIISIRGVALLHYSAVERPFKSLMIIHNEGGDECTLFPF
jgi:hypothetical protein